MPTEIFDPLAWLDKYTQDVEQSKPKNPKLPGPAVNQQQPNPPATGGGSGGYSSGGGYGGGGGGGGGAAPAADTGQQYLEDYRVRFFPDGKPPADLLKRAIKNNWSIAYFEQRVRLNDPRYFRSLEARTMLPEFNRTMKMLFPGLSDRTKQAALMKSPFYKKTALWYLKNGIGMLGDAGTEMVYKKITNTKRWNANNPSYRAYAKNADVNVQAEANPLVYKQLHTALGDAFKQIGIDVDASYYNQFFKSRYASSSGMKDLADNLNTIATTGGSYAWFTGKPMDSGTIKKAAFDSSTQGTDLRSRLNRQFAVSKSFFSGKQEPFQTSLNERNQLVQPLI